MAISHSKQPLTHTKPIDQHAPLVDPAQMQYLVGELACYVTFRLPGCPRVKLIVPNRKEAERVYQESCQAAGYRP